MEPILKNPCNGMPRTDYPSPMWKRDEWYCLNGEWEFEFDFGVSGEEREMHLKGDFSRVINVPYCPESALSGIKYIDFMPAVWYRKKININCPANHRAILHFGAVDYESKVWVNGKACGVHKGGYCKFEYDITDALCEGENTIVVMAKDDTRSDRQPTGKQCVEYISLDCAYTRTTGIWQTVWLEFVPDVYLKSAKMTPHASDGTLEVSLKGSQLRMSDYSARLTAYYKGKEAGQASAKFTGDNASLFLSVDEVHLWDVLAPEIYDLKIELLHNDKVVDTVESYFALRDISFNEKGLTVNGRPVFMRLILDQGYNEKGIYTAPDAEFLKNDIELSIALGFNGARFHQRVFEERSLYYADHMGYMVWVEEASGMELESAEATEAVTGEELTPVAVVGTQVVAVMNYEFLCIGRPSVKELEGQAIWDMVSVYVDLDGNCELVSVKEFDITDPAAGQVYEEGPMGAWECAIDGTCVEGEAAEAFDKTSKEFEGMKLTPAVLLGTQVVAGTNYRLLCVGETANRDYACVATVYEDLDGNAEITGCTVLDIGQYYEY